MTEVRVTGDALHVAGGAIQNEGPVREVLISGITGDQAHDDISGINDWAQFAELGVSPNKGT
jgi:hypothetical protein